MRHFQLTSFPEFLFVIVEPFIVLQTDFVHTDPQAVWDRLGTAKQEPHSQTKMIEWNWESYALGVGEGTKCASCLHAEKRKFTVKQNCGLLQTIAMTWRTLPQNHKFLKFRQKTCK